MRTDLNWLREASRLCRATMICRRLTVQPKFLSRGWGRTKIWGRAEFICRACETVAEARPGLMTSAATLRLFLRALTIESSRVRETSFVSCPKPKPQTRARARNEVRISLLVIAVLRSIEFRPCALSCKNDAKAPGHPLIIRIWPPFVHA